MSVDGNPGHFTVLSVLTYALPCTRIGSQFLGKYSDSVQAAFVYPSSNYEDDLAWGASWLYRKTGEQHFLDVRAQLTDSPACCAPPHGADHDAASWRAGDPADSTSCHAFAAPCFKEVVTLPAA